MRIFCYFLLQFLVAVFSGDPIALHQLIVVEPNGFSVIRLKAFDMNGVRTQAGYQPKLSYKIITLPDSGNLNQLSQVYSAYGYEPKQGVAISPLDMVTGSNTRVLYTRPSPDAAGVNKWTTFSFVVNDGAKDSFPGTVTLVPPSGNIIGSEFLLNNEGWTIVGNKADSMNATFEEYSRDGMLNHYIVATDDKINIASSGAADSSIWYFQAPSQFLGNIGISYGGQLQFTQGAFSGDFTKLNGNYLVEMLCSACQGPVTLGIKLIFPMSASTDAKNFNGATTQFKIPLLETAGWLQDPQNTLTKWTPPNKCDFIRVLSRLSSLRILGDWTTWYESVALDNVRFVNTVGQLPICAQDRPDASLCRC